MLKRQIGGKIQWFGNKVLILSYSDNNTPGTKMGVGLISVMWKAIIHIGKHVTVLRCFIAIM